MKSASVSILHLAAAAAALVSQGASLEGGPFSLRGQITAGGGTSTGGNFAISGAARTQWAGVYSNGPFELISPPADIFRVNLGDVALQIAMTGDGQVTISWPSGTAGYQLQFSSALGPDANWQTAPVAMSESSFTTPHHQTTRFYRLSRQ